MKQRELREYRNQYTKHYDLGDKQRQAVMFAQPVHYRDQDEWKEINNTLKSAQRDGRAVWRNEENPLKVEFSQQTYSERLVRVECEGGCIEWAFEAAAAANRGNPMAIVHNAACLEENGLPAELISEVSYDEVAPGIDARYTLDGMSCKEELIVKSREAAANAVLRIRSEDMTFTRMPDECVEVMKGDESVFRFAPPVVQDSGEGSEVMARVELTTVQGGVLLR